MNELIYRQAAIELLLKWADGYSYIETPTETAVEAFRELPSAQPDSNDMSGTRKALDTIIRQEATDAFQKELCREREYAIGFSGIERILNALPSAEPRMKGKWIERNVTDAKYIEEWQSARCSVCGLYHTTPYMYFFDQYNFCPSCGADMRGDEDE